MNEIEEFIKQQKNMDNRDYYPGGKYFWSKDNIKFTKSDKIGGWIALIVLLAWIILKISIILGYDIL